VTREAWANRLKETGSIGGCSILTSSHEHHANLAMLLDSR